MDDRQLEKILKDIEIPAPDGNAKKRAVNLALVEFDKYQKEKAEKRQGFSLFGRLTDSSDKNTRRTVMQRRLVYGGMATAMVVVLAATMSVTQQTTTFTKGAELKPAPAYTGGGGNDFSSIASNIQVSHSWFDGWGSKAKETAPEMHTADGREQVSQNYSNAVQETNKQNAVEKAVKSGNSALPAPVSTPQGKLSASETGQPADDGKVMEREEVASADAAAPKPSMPMQEPAKKENVARSRADLQAQVAGGKGYEADRLARQKMPETKAMASPPASVAIAPGVIAPQPPIVMNDEEVAQNEYKDVGRDKFEHVDDNPPKVVTSEPVSTFSIDVDTSSYSFMRREINEGVLPQKDSTRIEEMVNYFDYDYPVPETKEQPFKPTVSVEPCPWKKGDKLIHIGIKGYDLPAGEHPHSNLVFLLDTSGSMQPEDRLPLVIKSMKLLLESLQPDDTVAIVTYAGNAGTALEPTAVRDKDKIISVLDNLGAGGSTAGAEGIRQAYNLAEAHFDKKSVNRVILATDGDFNVGITDPNELKSFIERERDTGIFLSMLTVGEGNLNDQLMQDLAQNGNGTAAYIDNLNEARKVLVKEATSTLFPIAKDVKIQVEFNPATVAEYRLIGYETRHLNREDFNNDKIDAGEIGAGHAVTALYEITPVGGQRLVDDSRYQKPIATEELDKAKSDNAFSGEYAFLKIRYKLPDENTSKLLTTPITTADDHGWDNSSCGREDGPCKDTWPKVSDDTGWATAVAGFGQILRGGKYVGDFNYDDVINLAQEHKGKDEYGYRSEFIQLVRLAKSASAMQKN